MTIHTPDFLYDTADRCNCTLTQLANMLVHTVMQFDKGRHGPTESLKAVGLTGVRAECVNDVLTQLWSIAVAWAIRKVGLTPDRECDHLSDETMQAVWRMRGDRSVAVVRSCEEV